MNKKYLAVLAILLVLFSLSVAVISCGNEEARGVPVYKGTFIAGGDDYVRLEDGADLTVYSDDGVTSRFSVDGATGNVAVAGTIGLSGAVTVSSDVTISAESTGGNAGAKNELSGLPGINLVSTGAGTNGTTETAAYMDATPTGEWSESDAGTNLVVTADTTYWKDVTNSIKLAFTNVVDGDGVIGTAGAQDDLSANESIGFWWMTSAATSTGDFYLEIDDSDGTDQTYDIPASVAGVWQWVELDISGCDSNCDTMDNINVLASSAGGTAHTALNVYIDAMYKWDLADEEALSIAIVADGVISAFSAPTAGGALDVLAEYTDYVVNYQSGNDVIVWVSDQSANTNIVVVAY